MLGSSTRSLYNVLLISIRDNKKRTLRCMKMYSFLRVGKRKKTLNSEEAATDLIVRMHADDREVPLAQVTVEKFAYQN